MIAATGEGEDVIIKLTHRSSFDRCVNNKTPETHGFPRCILDDVSEMK
jgi:hypothetical protein